MTPAQFVKDYESALATQDWNKVEPLISNSAHITFSNGTVHRGIHEIQIAYEKNFASIKGEKYSIDNIDWLVNGESTAVYLFEFNWSGTMDGKLISGSGVGTAVLTLEDGKWQLLTEHLGRKVK